MCYLTAVLTPRKKDQLEESTDATLKSIPGGRERRKSQRREGKNLENGPYISLQTKGASETADLFITTLIWPWDKKPQSK